MKLVVVSSPEFFENEAAIINALFEEELEFFHLRKPGASEKELSGLLENIDAAHRSKVALHQQHGLAEQFGINGIHFPEKERTGLTEESIAALKKKGCILSSSVHDFETISKLSGIFDSVFFGPVFESISKPGYKPKTSFPLLENKIRETKIIAIGGITAENLNELKKNNFDGAALLGAVWSDPKNAIATFKKCKQNANM